MKTSKTVLENAPHPWGPDVEALAVAFGARLSEGAMFGHGTLAAVLGYGRPDQRYYDVVRAWRRKVRRETGLVLKAVPLVGYEVLKPAARIAHSGDLQRYGMRRIKRSVDIAAETPTDKLTGDQAAAREHLLKVGGAQLVIASTARKALDGAALRKALNG